MTYHPPCPQCNQNDKTYKVSLLYVEASARLHQREMAENPANQHDLDSLMSDFLSEGAEDSSRMHLIRQLVTALEPPSGEKRMVRQIHPDGYVFFFCLVSFLITYQVAETQRQYLPIILGLFFASLLIYFLARRSILARYQTRQNQDNERHQQVERAITRWMAAYFCSRDQIVFDPKEPIYAPLDQMASFLRGELNRFTP